MEISRLNNSISNTNVDNHPQLAPEPVGKRNTIAQLFGCSVGPNGPEMTTQNPERKRDRLAELFGCKMNRISSPSPVQSAAQSSFVGTTFLPNPPKEYTLDEFKMVPEDQRQAFVDQENKNLYETHEKILAGKGILDVVHTAPTFSYVIDGTGHGKPKNYDKMQEVNQFMQDKLTPVLTSNDFASTEELQAAVETAVHEVSRFTLDKGVAGTFSMAAITQVNGQKVALTFQLGDSSLFLVKKDGEMKQLTESNGSELSRAGKGSLVMGTHPVEGGDRIVGVTDGITDYLTENFLQTAFSENQEAPGIMERCMLELGKEGSPNQQHNFDSTSAGHSDDISGFVLKV